MKQRLLTALVGVGVAVAWMFSLYTPVYSAVLAVVAVIGEYEMLKVFEVKNLPFRIISMAVCGGAVLIADYKKYFMSQFQFPFFSVAAAVVLVSLIIMVFNFKKLKFEQVAVSLFSALAIGGALSCIILFRDRYLYEGYTKIDGLFLILFAFFCSWISDGFALFAGMAFGKHKLAPEISPKKTVEGAVGGVVGNVLFCTAFYFIMKKFFGLSGAITLPFTVITAAVLSVISIFGDLAASTIKRNHGIKDFGNLLPGHGGVMDRFDSSVFVFSALYGTLEIIDKFRF